MQRFLVFLYKEDGIFQKLYIFETRNCVFHIGTTGATARCMVDEFREKRFMHETVNYHKTYCSGDFLFPMVVQTVTQV